MPYIIERQMYIFVETWLENFLKSNYRRAEINVFDSSKKSLERLIKETGLFTNLSPEWPSWDIYVDVVGFIRTEKSTELAFVECKLSPINLSNLSQLLGYSHVAKPRYSFIISPRGISNSLKSLLVTYARTDILEYSKINGRIPLSIVVAKWNENSNSIDYESMITGDDFRVGRY